MKISSCRQETKFGMKHICGKDVGHIAELLPNRRQGVGEPNRYTKG